MNILFLDDSIDRYKRFIEWCKLNIQHNYNLLYAANYEDAKLAFRDIKEWGLVSLDHDLCINDIMCNPGVNNKEKTGTDVAELIAKTNLYIDIIMIHSLNYYGAKRMSDILLDVGYNVCYVPFGYPIPKKILDCINK